MSGDLQTLRGHEAPELSSASSASSSQVSVESIDFDFYESQEALAVKATRRQKLLRCLGSWTAAAMIGVLTGCTAAGIDYGIARLTILRFFLMRRIIEEGASSILVVLLQVALCTALAAVAGALVCFVSPLAAGSGIPEVKCRLNGLDLPLVVRPQTLVAKACGVLFSVSAGLPCGKEGPMIHSGAIIGSLCARWTAQSTFFLTRGQDERDLIAAGGAAGVASAFGAPVGGLLFALEEGASFWNPRILLQVLLSSTLAALTLNFFLGGFDSMGFGTLGALGALTFGSYFQSNATSYHLWELPFFLVLGLLGGLLGASFNALNVPLTRWRMRHIGPRGPWRFLEVLVVTALISCIFMAAPAALGSCMVTDVEQRRNAFVLSCEPASTNHALGLFMTPSEDAIKVLFHDPEHLHLGLLLLFGVTYFAMACWTYGLGVPSGLFVPSLLLGAVLGRGMAEILRLMGLHGSPGYALVGAASSLAGMARITVSLAVILVEATGNTQYSLPILLAVMLSRAVGDIFNQGIYDIHIHLKKLPILEASSEAPVCTEPISSLMTSTVESLQPMETHERLSKALATSHNAFPLVTSSGSFLGMASRLAVTRIYEPSAPGETLDLTACVNLGAFRIAPEATVRRAYDLFRTMGLRHLAVVDGKGSLRGLVTRKDLFRLEA